MDLIYALRSFKNVFDSDLTPRFARPHSWEASVTIRDEPKINRRREKKARNAALRLWKKRFGIKGRLPEAAFQAFATAWRETFKEA